MATKKKSKQKPKQSEPVKKTITKIPEQDAALNQAEGKNTNIKSSKKDETEKEEKVKKSPKKSKKNKKNIFVRAWEFIKSVFTELKKVTWLTGEELAKSTAVVAGMVAVMTLLVWLVDTGLGFMAAKLIGS